MGNAALRFQFLPVKAGLLRKVSLARLPERAISQPGKIGSPFNPKFGNANQYGTNCNILGASFAETSEKQVTLSVLVTFARPAHSVRMGLARRYPKYHALSWDIGKQQNYRGGAEEYLATMEYQE